MDPIELLALCKRGAYEGAPPDIVVPRIFSLGEYEDLWRREHALVRATFDELLCGPIPGDGLELLLKSGILHALIPELVAIKNLGDDPASSRHKDVWEHTKQVVANVPNLPEMRWAALMHDIGKSRTRAFDGRKVTFHNHDVVGAHMVDGIQRRLHLFRDDEPMLATIRMLVLNHLRPAQYKKEWADSGVRRLLADVGGMANFKRLMSLSRADLTTKNPAKRDRARRNGDELEAHITAVFEADNAPRLPKGAMGEIVEKVAAKPGKWCNDLRDELQEMMRAGLLEVDREVEYYVEAGLRIVEEKAYVNR